MKIKIIGWTICLLLLGLFTGCIVDDETLHPGPYTTIMLTITLDDGSDATIFYPDSTIQNAPLVIFSNGWNQIRTGYFAYAKTLAEWGFVVVVRFYPSLGVSFLGQDFIEEHIEQVSHIIDRMEEENTNPASSLYGMVDTSRVGLSGHSMGGVVSSLAAMRENRVQAVVNIDGCYVDSGSESLIPSHPLSPPSLLIEAEMGGFCSRNPFALYGFYDIHDGIAMKMLVKNANHMDFMMQDLTLLSNIGRYLVCSGGNADPREVRMLTARYMLAWFGYFLCEDQDFLSNIRGLMSEADEMAGLVSFERKGI